MVSSPLPTDPAEPAAAAWPALPGRFADLRPLRGRSRDTRFIASDAAGGGPVLVKLGPAVEVGAEARLLAAVDHPGVVRVRASGSSGDQGWLAVDLEPGVDLEAWLARNALTVGETRRLLERLAEILAAVHAAGIVHRDVKPSNVVLRPDGFPVLVDFGAARPAGDRTAAAGVPSALTHGYAAPEQYAAGGREGPWTDVYALAALGYRLLTGVTPPSAQARLHRDTVGPVREHRPDCPADLAEAVDRGLALGHMDRPRDMRAWRAMLDGAVAAFTPPPDEGPPTVKITREIQPAGAPEAEPAGSGRSRVRQRSGRLFWLAAVAVLAGPAGFAAWRYWVVHTKQEWVVDPSGAGDARTIAEAIGRARAGARVLVRPGTYPESLRLDRPVRVAAADPAVPPVIAPATLPCVVIEHGGVELAHLALRAPPAGGSGPAAPCLAATRGDPAIEELTVDASAGPALAVDDGAAPRVRGGRFTAADAGPAVLFAGGAGGLVEGATLTATASGPSLVVREGAAPEVRRSALQGGGATVAEGARPVLRENRIEGVRGSAVEVGAAAAPAILANTIARPAEAGIFAHDAAGGRIEGNQIDEPGLSGIVVTRMARPELVANTVRRPGEHGILVVEGGGGAIDGNRVEGARGHGIVLGPGSEVRLGENRLEGGRRPQLFDGRAP